MEAHVHRCEDEDLQEHGPVTLGCECVCGSVFGEFGWTLQMDPEVATQLMTLDRKRRKKWVPLNYLTWNTHMGATLTKDVWSWIRDQFPRIHVLFLQEVDDPKKLEEVLGDDWYFIPERKTGRATTYLAVRRKRFPVNTMVRSMADISYRSKHHRILVGMGVADKRTGRRVFFGSVHTDPLGKGFQNANRAARRRHIKQTRAFAVWMKSNVQRMPDAVHALGGDFNERLADKIKGRIARQTARAQFQRAGLTAAFAAKNQYDRVRLDDVFVRQTGFCRIQSRRQVTVPKRISPHFDHDLVFVRTKVRVR